MPVKYKRKKRQEIIKTKTVKWEGFKRTSETVIQTREISDVEHDHNVPLIGDTSRYKNEKPITIRSEIAKCIRDKRRSKKDQKRLTR